MLNDKQFPSHPQYSYMHPCWETMRDVIVGDKAIKEGGNAAIYLPKPEQMSSQTYEAYKKRALFFNATSRTLDGLVGTIMRVDPVVEAPSTLNDIVENITNTGMDITAFAQMLVYQVLSVGRCGVLVDKPYEQDDNDNRAYVRLYRAEDIINWRTINVYGKEVLDQVVLHEDYAMPTDIGSKELEMIRVLNRRLDPETGMVAYSATVYQKNEDGKWLEIAKSTPTLNGAPMDYIPFEFFNTKDNSSNVDQPPLLDIANVNLSHYRTSADRESALFRTSIPTLMRKGGHTADPITIGTDHVINLPGDADLSYLEYSGAGLSEITKALEDKQKMMAVLGSRMLEESKAGVEAADTLRLRVSGETSTLANIAKTVSRGLTNCLQWIADWQFVTGEVSIELNTDFTATRLNPAEIAGLLNLWKQGAMPTSELLKNLVRGEILSNDVTEDDLDKKKEEQSAGNMPPKEQEKMPEEGQD